MAGGQADSLHPDNDLDNMPVMAISINSQECQMTAEEVISMSEPQFATLWKVNCRILITASMSFVAGRLKSPCLSAPHTFP